MAHVNRDLEYPSVVATEHRLWHSERVIFAVTSFAVASYSKADLEADTALLDNLMKTMRNDTVSPAVKKAKLDEAFAQARGDWKAKFDTFLEHAKQKANSMPTEGSKKAANDTIAMWKDGTFFLTRDQVCNATVQHIYTYDYKDNGIVEDNFLVPLYEEFQNTFKDIAPNGIHYYI